MGQLAPGRYYWQVEAYTADGLWSPWSEKRSFTIVSPQAPSAPLLVQPGAGASLLQDAAVTLEWSSVAGGAQYKVEWQRDGDSIQNSGKINATSHYLGQLAPGTYYWQVEAYTADGLWSPWSERRTFTIVSPHAPSAPLLVQPGANGVFDEGDSVRLTWSSNFGEQFFAELQGAYFGDGWMPNGWYETNEWEVHDLEPDLYQWRVKARSGVNESPWSATGQFIIRPSAPTIQSAQPVSCRQINLTWSTNSNHTEYFEIYRDNSLIGWVWSGTTHYDDSGVDGNTTYTYYVKGLRYRLGGVSESRVVTTQPCNDDERSTVHVPYASVGSGPSGPSDPLGMVLIPAGTFQMGCDSDNSAESCNSDEQPLHTVYLDAYYIDRYEVTNVRYQACVDAGACMSPLSIRSGTRASYYGNPTYDDYPVVNVLKSFAVNFCAWEGKRLPTEAEWEKAARGNGDLRKFPWGNEAPTCIHANWGGQPSGCVGDTNAVGSYPMDTSPYGVMDMAGNVQEWVNDYYNADYYSLSPDHNPTGPPEKIKYDVMRGGSWYPVNDMSGNQMRVAKRGWDLSTVYGSMYGFRCVRTQ